MSTKNKSKIPFLSKNSFFLIHIEEFAVILQKIREITEFFFMISSLIKEHKNMKIYTAYIVVRAAKKRL